MARAASTLVQWCSGAQEGAPLQACQRHHGAYKSTAEASLQRGDPPTPRSPCSKRPSRYPQWLSGISHTPAPRPLPGHSSCIGEQGVPGPVPHSSWLGTSMGAALTMDSLEYHSRPLSLDSPIWKMGGPWRRMNYCPVAQVLHGQPLAPGPGLLHVAWGRGGGWGCQPPVCQLFSPPPSKISDSAPRRAGRPCVSLLRTMNHE